MGSNFQTVAALHPPIPLILAAIAFIQSFKLQSSSSSFIAFLNRLQFFASLSQSSLSDSSAAPVPQSKFFSQSQI